MKSALKYAALLPALVLFAGCACKDGCTCPDCQEDKAEALSGATINTTCPVEGTAVNAGHTTTYDGATVGFCCDGCAATFNSWPAEKKASYVANARNSAR